MPQAVTRLDEFDMIEWWDVCRVLRPKLTWDEFEIMWDDFQKFKAAHQKARR